MAAASGLLSEDQFLCSICLEVFRDPVTIPCGHNFCKACINQHWNISVPCQCPLCKESFEKKPDLRINTFISEMAAQFKQSVPKETSSISVKQHTNTGDVLCDVCTETKLEALKSCLVCLVSYCDTHLELHHRIPALKRHELIDPVENLEGQMCKKHKKPLEHFCTTDQLCVCQFCTESDHKLHRVVPLGEEYGAKKAELAKTEAEVQQMIQKRKLKMEEIKESVRLSKEEANRERATSVQVFTQLVQFVEKGLARLIDMIEEKQDTTENQAEGFIKDLEEEISQLEKRSAEMKQLSSNENHLQFLQNVRSLNPVPSTKDWTKVRVQSSCKGTLREGVTQLEKTLIPEMKKLCADAEIKMNRQYSVDVSLDPETAHSKLILSDDGKQVRHGDAPRCLPNNPKRITLSLGALGKQSFSSGRLYYEVQVEEKTDWILGVTRESINRKCKFELCPNNGQWMLCLSNGHEYKVFTDPTVRLYLKSKPQKVGVFVDYEEGLVSFYDVDAAALIYSFTGYTFTGKLYPYFNPKNNNGGKNSTPLIICPVNQAEH